MYCWQLEKNRKQRFLPRKPTKNDRQTLENLQITVITVRQGFAWQACVFGMAGSLAVASEGLHRQEVYEHVQQPPGCHG